MISMLAVSLAAIAWPLETLFTTPKTFDASAYATNGVQVTFYEGLPYKGKETRVFAYYGVPHHEPGKKVPAMVLVHGGGGSAFYRWVKFWNDRGYAAISMDTCGKVSGNVLGDEQRKHFPHAWAGPAGWGGFRTMADADEDHWVYHAVAAVIRGHSFLRSLPDVDPDRIGITGVSWGGILTCISASLDDRFKFAAPVYGCGDNFVVAPAWTNNCSVLGAANVPRWKVKWDPVNYLPQSKVPFHWLDGTNDPWFALPAIEGSRRALSVPNGATIRVRMVHTHGRVSEQAAEIVALADHHLRCGPALPRFDEISVTGDVVSAGYACDEGLRPVRAVLDYTVDAPDGHGFWFLRKWQSADASLESGRVTARLPKGTKAFYLNLEAGSGVRVSSHVQCFTAKGLVNAAEDRLSAPIVDFGAAKWMWPASLGSVSNTVVEFRNCFESGRAGRARLAVAADTVYAVGFNGKKLHTGRFPDVPPQRYYDVLDLDGVRKGRNEIKFSLYVQGVDSFQTLPGDPGLMFSLVGDDVLAVSGPGCEWRLSAKDMREGVPLMTRQLGYSFEYDAGRPELPWRKLTADDAVRGVDDFALTKRPVPCVDVLPVVPARTIGQGRLDGTPAPREVSVGMDATVMKDVRKDDFFEPDGKTVRPDMFGDGFFVLADLGKETAGFLSLDIETDEGVVIDIGHAEHCENGRIRTHIGNRNFAGRYRSKEGRQSYCRWTQRMAGRYLQLHVRGVRTRFVLHGLSVRPTELPLTERPAPAGLTQLQRKIWETSVRTLRLCMHEHYEDCPWREQALYGNDARNQMLCGYYAFDERNRMPELSLELLARGLRSDGWLEMCMPARFPLTIPSFTFCWVLSVEDNLRHRGNVEFSRTLMPVVGRILDARVAELRDGLLPCPEGEGYWQFYEWSEGLNGERGVRKGEVRYESPLNLFFILALESAARCADAMGEDERAGRWRDAAALVRKETTRRFWNGKSGCLEFDSDEKTKPAELVQALALLAHVIPDGARASVARKLSHRSEWTETTLSQSLYKYEALLAEGGDVADSVIPAIDAEWASMLEKGATSFWEMREGWRAFDEAASLCHGWSALPVYFYNVCSRREKAGIAEPNRRALAWRGLHLDEARHFFGKETVKRVLGKMAEHGLNVFHWHLVDDQGWRIQIDRYPKLVERGAVRRIIPRKDSPQPYWREKTETGTYGPYYYTKTDIREVVDFAHALGIKVVPEIEIPGHETAACAAYPFLSCRPEALEGEDTFMHPSWRTKAVGKRVFCLGKETTYRFLEGVLDEVCELFPDEYVHLGGDEAPIWNWKSCANCQERIRRLRLKDEVALKHFAMRHFADYVISKGRTPIVWDDDSAEAGLSKKTIVMVWHEPEDAEAVMNNGYRVIMTPNRFCYLDYLEKPSIEDVRTFNPFKSISEANWNKVVGVQCCNWTEGTLDESDLMVKMWPRASVFGMWRGHPAGTATVNFD